MSTPSITPDLSQPGAGASPAPTQAPAPGPHSTLLRMVQGLAVGVGAFAQSAATQGREGGPAAVQAFQSEQQKQQLRAQESQQSAQTAQREQQEGDLRMQGMRAQMQIGQFQLENMRQRAPLEIQKTQNEIAEQQMGFMERLSKDTGLPLMVIQSMANDDTQTTLSAMSDKAKEAGTTLHDVTWTHVQNDHAPGNGSKVVGIDLAKYGQKSIKSEFADVAALPVKSQVDLGANVLGESDPTVKAGRQLLQQLQTGLNSGNLSLELYTLISNRITAPIANAMGVKHATAAAQKEQAEATKAQQEADPAFQVRQAGLKKGAETAAEAPFAGPKAAAEAKARQPYEVALKNLEAPIAAGVQNDEKAKETALTYVKGYVDKMNGVNELKSSLTQAANGNVAASRAVLLKLLGISVPGGGSKRISPEALQDMGQMGSEGQKWFGSIKDALTGDKWTSGMVQDMRDFADAQAMKAKQNLSMGIHTLNAVRGTKLDPDEIVRSANQDQGWNQQSDSASDNPSAPQPLGSKYGPPVH